MGKIYYSGSTNGFYIEGVHQDIPSDRVEINPEQHRRLMGQDIYAGTSGRPVLREPPPMAGPKGVLGG